MVAEGGVSINPITERVGGGETHRGGGWQASQKERLTGEGRLGTEVATGFQTGDHWQVGERREDGR